MYKAFKTFLAVPALCTLLMAAPALPLPAAASEAAVLKRTPFFAPSPRPTTMATGVASPSAQGQLMTSTEMPRASA